MTKIQSRDMNETLTRLHSLKRNSSRICAKNIPSGKRIDYAEF